MMQLTVKRIIDIIFALVLVAMAWPMFLVCLVMTGWQLGFPIFFTQDRLGQHGKRFRIWKFRTMFVDAQQIVKSTPHLAELYATDYKIPCYNNSLVPFWGRIMRTTSLDELPQLFNILKGDMSIVGPRPIVPEEIEKYEQYGQKLLTVKPGLTGYWQVYGRNRITYPDRIFYDMYYIDHQSLLLDLKIVLRTPWVLLTMDGSN